MNQTYLNEKFPLVEQFTPSSNTSGEIKKARIKNSNLPFLQFMYYGNPCTPLQCLITGRYGWVLGKDYGDQKPKKRFRIDFNHIRQKCNESRTSGVSLDKCDTPSGLFRECYLDPNYKNRVYSTKKRQRKRELDVLEFISIMPVCSEEHSFISQDSSKHDLVLTNFDKSTWAWCLKNSKNFNETKDFLGIKHYDVDYDFIIDHLSHINHDNLIPRVKRLFP